MPVTCICEHCDKPFTVIPSQARRGRGVYCSRECSTQGRTHKVTMICEHCGKSFAVSPCYVQRNRRYCSQACYDNATITSQTLTCASCGKPFHASVFWIKRGTKRYCSKPCYGIAMSGAAHPRWKGGVSSRPFNAKYIAWRKVVFERDDYTCQHCKQKGGDLNAHHIKPWVSYPALRYEASNGLTLCLKCHRRTYREYKVA